MITVVKWDNITIIPAEIASAFGIEEGTLLERTDAGSGSIVVRPVASRSDGARALMGAGRKWLKAGGDPVADLLKERAAADSDDDVSLRHVSDPGTSSC
jgi:bifunctional DNA-binding transcriptional regulator/antitoxin component of YhaV-PrlF toxin-antitoxin module